MGTRCLTVVKDFDGSKLFVLYKQYDGYLSGWGAALEDFLQGREVGNGIRSGDNHDKFSNGMQGLAVQLVSHFASTKPGGFYVYSTDTSYDIVSYVYEIYPEHPLGTDHERTTPLCLKILDFKGQVVYEGPVSEFDAEDAENSWNRKMYPEDFEEELLLWKISFQDEVKAKTLEDALRGLFTEDRKALRAAVRVEDPSTGKTTWRTLRVPEAPSGKGAK